MLRVNTFKSAQGAIDYFNESLAGDYYSEDEKTIGIWGGKDADKLGLMGAVDRKHFRDLLLNRDPEGRRMRPRWTSDGRSGFDFTFDVPKSVSVIFELGQDSRVREAFERVSAEVMMEIEKEAAVRVRQDGANHDRQTGRMLWSRFTHRTSRPVDGVSDCHLHAHFFVLNQSWDQEAGGFRALQAGAIKGSAYYFEALHHSKMAAAMEELGYEVVRKGKSWEIAGASDELISKFSRRKEQIEAEIARKGLESERVKGGVGAKTRSKKQETSIEDLRKEWLSRLSREESQWLDKSLSEARRGPRETNQAQRYQSAKEAVEFVIKDTFENRSVIAERRFYDLALRRCVGRAGIAEVKAVLDECGIKRRRLGEDRFFTTAKVEAEERRMLDTAKLWQNKLAPAIKGRHVFQREFLNVGQRAAVQHVLSSGDRITAIRGAAGTGKTTLMVEAIEAMQKKGLRVRTFAPSSDASRVTLRNEGFKDAETVAMLLLNPKVQESVKGGVIWIDEAGLLGTRDMLSVMDLADRQKARIVLSGDYKQHSSVQRGDALRLLIESKAVRSREVTEILRQRGDYRKAMESLSQGRVGEGFETLDSLQAIREINDDETRFSTVADDYVRLLREKKSALVVSPTHAEAKQVTDKIRSRLREEKKLRGEENPVFRQINRHWGEGTKGDSSRYQPGDILQFIKPAPGFQKGSKVEITGRNKNGDLDYRFLGEDKKTQPLPLKTPDRFQVYSQTELKVAAGEKIRITQGGSLSNRYRLENGSIHEVKKVHDDGAIECKNGQIIPKYWGNLAHGYVSTSYSAQGKTVDEVLVAQSSDSLPASSREQFYVSSSRGRENLRIYTDNKEQLLDAVGASHTRVAAVETKPDVIRPKKPKPETVRPFEPKEPSSEPENNVHSSKSEAPVVPSVIRPTRPPLKPTSRPKPTAAAAPKDSPLPLKPKRKNDRSAKPKFPPSKPVDKPRTPEPETPKIRPEIQPTPPLSPTPKPPPPSPKVPAPPPPKPKTPVPPPKSSPPPPQPPKPKPPAPPPPPPSVGR